MFFVVLAIVITIIVIKSVNKKKYRELESAVLQKLGFPNWNVASNIDATIVVKSRQALENYDAVKFFKENEGSFDHAKSVISRKTTYKLMCC